MQPWYLAEIVAVYSRMGRPDDGLDTLAEARRLVETTGERRNEAELYRLQGELVLQGGTRRTRLDGTPEAWFEKALTIARQQQATSLELRAAMSLSRLWQQHGKRLEAYQLLAGVYGWFTEGWASRDLSEARALLTELALPGLPLCCMQNDQILTFS